MAHPPSKEQLEEAWQRSRVGWLKYYNKTARNKKPYTLVAKVYTKQYLEPVEMTVWAKDHKAAMKETWRLSPTVREKYPHEQYKDIAWSYGIKETE